ncbi:MAG: response regulator [Planctomycetota bacterium]|jgi:response regulator RpfG family c-di-GMP phosphodiesterase
MSSQDLDYHLRRAHVLIVEDDSDHCAILDRLFVHHQYEHVHILGEGKSALNYVLESESNGNPVDLVILDLMLPGDVSGQDIYHSLCSVIDIPIVIMTSCTDTELQMDALQYLEVAEYFIKPLDPELFILKCERLLSRQVFARHASAGARHSQRLFLNVLQVMAKVLETKDSYTRYHSENVAKFARQIARRFGYQGAELENIQIAGILHDFGKIGIREDILNKPGCLTDLEYMVVKRHPMIASTILEPIEELEAVIRDIRHHHEHFDGSGYPDGLVGEAIPLGARILAVADAFDAMTSQRAYHDPRSQEEALDELSRCSGAQFDPLVVKELCSIMDEADLRRKKITEIRKKAD